MPPKYIIIRMQLKSAGDIHREVKVKSFKGSEGY